MPSRRTHCPGVTLGEDAELELHAATVTSPIVASAASPAAKRLPVNIPASLPTDRTRVDALAGAGPGARGTIVPMESPYLHGHGPGEQERLRHQAKLLASRVHDGLPFAECRRLLEVGCGVGGQSAILLRSFPALHLTGIDLSESQVSAARHALGADPDLAARSEFVTMDAHELRFGSGAFDGAFLCWILEHLPRARRALEEVRRVLAAGAPIVCSEVLGSSLWLDPYGPDVASFWRAYLDHQIALGGDPFVGARLGDLLWSTGFREVVTEPRAIHLDGRDPAERSAIAAYTIDLLLSAAPAMVEAGRVTPALVDGMRRDLERVATDDHGVFFYTFIQARARA